VSEPQLGDLQKRILIAALRGEGRIILWVLSSGRVVIPGFTQEDAADGLRALEGAGLLTLGDAERKFARGSGSRSAGSHVFYLTEAGTRAAQHAVGRVGPEVRKPA
jgi:hypothetical protein